MPPRKRKATSSSRPSQRRQSHGQSQSKRPRTRLFIKENPLYIDHLCYPHIIDAILEYGGWSAQLMFRATCKDFRHRVDSQIAKHMVVRCDDRYAYAPSLRRIISFHSPNGAIKGFPDIKEQHLLQLVNSKRPRDCWMRTILQHVETLDIVMSVPLPVRKVLGTVAKKPQLVRYIRFYPVHGSSERSDLFTAIQAPTIVLWPGLRLKHNDGTHAPPLQAIEVEEGQERLVMQHHFRQYQTLLQSRRYYVITSKGKVQPLKEIVILFSLPEPHPDDDDDDMHWDGHAVHNRNSLFVIICGLAFNHHPATAIKFVGLDAIPPQVFDLVEGTPFEMMKQQLALGVRTKATLSAWHPLRPEDVEATLRKIQYSTLDEYKADIGEARFAAEMSASPPAPPELVRR